MSKKPRPHLFNCRESQATGSIVQDDDADHLHVLATSHSHAPDVEALPKPLGYTSVGVGKSEVQITHSIAMEY
jgi:hypothetical protein